MEVVDCGWEAHDQRAVVVKSEVLRVGVSSPAALRWRMNWKERHLGKVKTAAEAALVEYMSISKIAEQSLALEEVVLAGKRIPVQDSSTGLGAVIR